MLVQHRARAILVEKDLVSKYVLIGFHDGFGEKLAGSHIADVEKGVLLESSWVVCRYAREHRRPPIHVSYRYHHRELFFD